MVSADLIDKPFPRSCFTEDSASKFALESAKRKEMPKEPAAAAAESSSHKDSTESMICLHLLHRTVISAVLFFIFCNVSKAKEVRSRAAETSD